jgi:hypothetical protein
MNQTYQGLRWLLIVHGVLTFAAGVALIVAPNLIPSVAGITLEPGAYLVAYLLASAEFGFAALSLRAAQLTDAIALNAIVLACVVFHGSSGIVEAYAIMRGVRAVVWFNVAARAIVIALFLYFKPQRIAQLSSINKNVSHS